MRKGDQLLASRDNKRAKTFWASFSDYYVKVTRFDDLHARTTVEAYVREGAIQDGHRVLDAGCGHLRISLALLHLMPAVQIVGADLTHNLLVEGKTSFEEIRGTSPEVACADLVHLPFEDNEFDAAMSARVFHYIEDPLIALAELRRVLKPGGRLVYSVPNSYNPIKRLRYPGKLYAPRDLGAWLKGAGFVDVHMRSMCFFPFGGAWESRWCHLERIAFVPILGLIGGNAIASGQKPR